MRKPKQLFTNKKGVSSLFIGIFVTLFLLILLSTLFVGLSVFNSSVTNYLKIEEDRMQEKILIAGPNAIIVNSTDGEIQALLVNNTGALTSRIRALYIAGNFVCDPATLQGDSYIAPQDFMWINLSSIDSPIKLDNTTLNGLWTVTTERGIKSSDTGENLWLGPPLPFSDPNKVYFGPLLLFYNWFHWSDDGGATWNNGWSIPKQPDAKVIWRILIANIDDRPIHLSSTSTFSLIQNSDNPNKYAIWNIDQNGLNPQDLYLEPGHYYFLHFGTGQQVNVNDLFSQNPVCLNFLTFIGSFDEPGDNDPPFGQTIPFEAVLITG